MKYTGLKLKVFSLRQLNYKMYSKNPESIHK